ncbi:glucosamine-6-phosphate deaminase [Lolliginicoccus suaedae]|uniref:glucosamine-6-phosphate deaminase n=1 Tax=Lolliginicoccus suaedae TaxID=2605429 RepID=UPI0011ED5490|nr:glucosamine-6-phosphate deaminase [Lolliginicoccus suaedae]
MEVVIAADPSGVARAAADIVARALRHRVVNLGVATGSSPVPTYQELAQRVQHGELSFAHARVFLLDEYVGLPRGHAESYHQVIRRDLTEAAGIPESRIEGPRGDASDLIAEADRYDHLITTHGGIDLQILGIGTNGHIGFNEPPSSLSSRTRVVALAEQTRMDNSRFFDHLDDVPQLALTQGLGTISEAREIVLIATGARKAPAVAAAVEGPLAARCPASILQWHPRATFVVDTAAASKLELPAYGRDHSGTRDRP